MKDNQGIYGIKVNNEVVYVGKSSDIKNRWASHRARFKQYSRTKSIKSQEHLYKYLSQHIDKVEFVVLSNVNTNVEEKLYMDKYKPILNRHNSLNIPHKVSDPEYKKIWAKENKDKRKQSLKKYRSTEEYRIKHNEANRIWRAKQKAIKDLGN